MDMALDDIIMQERDSKRKKIKQEKAAMSKAKSKAPRNSGSGGSGPQRARDVGRIEIRAKAKPYASSNKTTPVISPIFSKSSPSIGSSGSARKKTWTLPTVFTVSNPAAISSAATTSTTASSSSSSSNVFSVHDGTPSGKRMLLKKKHNTATTTAATTIATTNNVMNPAIRQEAPTAPKQSISILGEAGPAYVQVENLHPGATPDDIKTVFSRFGQVKDCVAFYDQHGRSTGRAEICYAMKAHALNAIKALNNAEADGYILRVQLLPPKTGTSRANPTQHNAPIHSVQKSGPVNTQRSRSASGQGGRLYSDQLLTTPNVDNNRAATLTATRAIDSKGTRHSHHPHNHHHHHHSANQSLHRSTKGLMNNGMPFATSHGMSPFQSPQQQQQQQQHQQRKSPINPSFNVLF